MQKCDKSELLAHGNQEGQRLGKKTSMQTSNDNLPLTRPTSYFPADEVSIPMIQLPLDSTPKLLERTLHIQTTI